MSEANTDAQEALREAAEQGDREGVARALEAGAGKLPPEALQDALFQTAEGGHLEVARLLVEKGADVSAKDWGGWSLAARAVAAGHGALADFALGEQGSSRKLSGNPARALLLGAAVKGDLARLEQGFALGEKVDFCDEQGLTALHCAAQNGHLAVVLRLLERGAKIEAKDREDRTAAASAAHEGHRAVVAALAEKGASLDRALVEAAGRGDLEIVNDCLAKKAKIESRDQYGETPLFKAAEDGHLEVVRLLLAKKAKVDVRNINGWTPLLMAARRGHAAVCELLCEHGADPNYATEYSYENALGHAAEGGYLEVVQVLTKRGANILERGNYRPMFLAAREGRLEVLAFLLEEGADLENKDDDGDTALSRAAANGKVDAVRFLLERGAENTERAMSVAAERGHGEVVALLRQRGVQLPRGILLKAAEGGNAEIVGLALEQGDSIEMCGGYWKRTPLLAAANAGSVEAVALLLDHGADLTAVDEQGRNALELATERRAPEVVRLLVERGARPLFPELVELAAAGDLPAVSDLLGKRASPDVRNQQKRTPLHEAAAGGHVEIVKALLAAGASLDLTDDDGWTALMEASDLGHTEIAELLLSAGADPLVTDGYQFSAYRLAYRGGHQAIVEMFQKRKVPRSWPDTHVTGKVAVTPGKRAQEIRKERILKGLAYSRRAAYLPVLEAGDGAASDSKMGGTPLLLEGETWPICKGCKRPMLLLLQLDLGSLPRHAPVAGKGHLQVFHCGRSGCDRHETVKSPGGRGVLLRLVSPGNEMEAQTPKKKTPKAEAAAKVKAPSKAKPAVDPVVTEPPGIAQAARIVSYQEVIETPGAGDLDTSAYDAKEQSVVRAMSGSGGDKIGGFPSWIQSPNWARCPTCKLKMSLLAQLTARLVDFGDSGLGYVMQCSLHPQKLAFNWSST